MNFKKTLSLIISIVILIIVNLTVFAINKREQKVLYENREIILSDSYINDENRLYVPLRELCEKMGLVVVWNNDTQSAHISPKNGTILDPEVKEGQIKKFQESLKEPVSGVLDNGSEFSFVPENGFYDHNYKMDYVEYAKDSNLNLDYSIDNAISTLEKAVEYTQIVLNESNIKRSYSVFYDFDQNAWIVLSKPTQSFTYGITGLVIRSYDGCIICRLYGGWNNVDTNIEQIYGVD